MSERDRERITQLINDFAVEELAEYFATEMGMPETFLGDLKSEDDWSFVIKLHALMEAALVHTLVEGTGLTAASESFSRLAMWQKTMLAEELGLIVDDEPQFLRKRIYKMRIFGAQNSKDQTLSKRNYMVRTSKEYRSIELICPMHLSKVQT